MAEFEENLDLTSLEAELKDIIHVDHRYWQQNDAKIRAVNQRVATYEDFREIVKASHLKPLDRNEGLGLKKISVSSSSTREVGK